MMWCQDSDAAIEHRLFNCPDAQQLWAYVYEVLGSGPPSSVAQVWMFEPAKHHSFSTGANIASLLIAMAAWQLHSTTIAKVFSRVPIGGRQLEAVWCKQALRVIQSKRETARRRGSLVAFNGNLCTLGIANCIRFDLSLV